MSYLTILQYLFLVHSSKGCLADDANIIFFFNQTVEKIMMRELRSVDETTLHNLYQQLIGAMIKNHEVYGCSEDKNQIKRLFVLARDWRFIGFNHLIEDFS